MYSILRLIFSRRYWQYMLHPSTWGFTFVSLRRFHRDARARKHILHMVRLLLFPVLALIYISWIIGSGSYFLIPVLVGIVFLTRRYLRRYDAATTNPLSINASLNPATAPAPIAEKYATPETRLHWANHLLLLAVQIDRAGSETFLRHKELPENFVVNTRRTHIDLLRERNLWDTLSSDQRQLFMLPDGGWSPEQCNAAINLFERLRMLRFVLGLDTVLTVLPVAFTVYYALAKSIVQSPATLFNATFIHAPWNLRPIRNRARSYFMRCLAEAIRRGLHVTDDPELIAWAEKVNQELSGNQSTDPLIGNTIVSEATDDQLRLAYYVGRQRAAILSEVIDSMSDTLSTPHEPQS